jgi:hypothetical protein
MQWQEVYGPTQGRESLASCFGSSDRREKNMNYRWSVSIALAVLVFAFALAAANTPAKPGSLEEYLYGKWHQEYGPYVTETVLNTDLTFTSVTVQKGAPYRLYVEGKWKVKYQNQLWMYWVNWEPRSIKKPLPEGTTVEVIDHNHFRNKLGVVTRIG